MNKMTLSGRCPECREILQNNKLSTNFHCAGEPGPRDPKQEVFLAFARVFSGVVTDGQRVHVLSAAYNPARPDLERQEVQVRTPSKSSVRHSCKPSFVPCFGLPASSFLVHKILSVLSSSSRLSALMPVISMCLRLDQDNENPSIYS